MPAKQDWQPTGEYSNRRPNKLLGLGRHQVSHPPPRRAFGARVRLGVPAGCLIAHQIAGLFRRPRVR